MGEPERPTKLSRNELLMTGGEFTVQELREIALGEEDENGGRPLLTVSESCRLRLLPSKLQLAVRDILETSGDTRTAINVLHSAFVIFRECVSNEAVVPLLLGPDGVLEWLEPARFKWGDFDVVNFIGMALGSGQISNSAKVSVLEERLKYETDVFSGEKVVLEMSEFAAHPDRNLKFLVARLKDIRFMNSMTWQQLTLRVFATGLMRAVDDIRKGRLREEEARNFLKSLSSREGASETPDLPVLRYAQENEQSDIESLFFFV